MTSTTSSTTTTTNANTTAEMWSQAAAAYQAYNNSAQWSNAAAQMYNTGNTYSTNQWDANSYQTNWNSGNTNNVNTASNYNTAGANQWYAGYNTGSGDTSSYSTGNMATNQNNQSAYTANTAAFSTNTGYVDNSAGYNNDGYNTGAYGNQYGNYGYQGGFGNKGGDDKGRGFGNRDKGGGNNRAGGGRNGGGQRDRDRSGGRNDGRDNRGGGGRFGNQGNQGNQGGGRFGGGGGRDGRDGKRKDPFQGAPEFDKPYNPKRMKINRDMDRMSNMIENTSQTINNLRRGWSNMDGNELNKKVEFLINQQMMLIDRQSQMAELLERREMEMEIQMQNMMKERDDMMRALDGNMRFGPDGGMGSMQGPGPRWSRDARDNSWISPEESVMRFTEYLLFFQPKSNNVQTLIRAVISSRLNIKVEMRFKEIEKDGETFMRGHLLLGYFVLDHAYKKSLKELRDFLFDRALYTLMTKTLGHIAVNSNRVMEAKKNEDRMIRGDEMCEINGAEAVKIWSSRKNDPKDQKDGKDEKTDEKSEEKGDGEGKDEEKEIKEEPQDDEEMKEEGDKSKGDEDIKQEDDKDEKHDRRDRKDRDRHGRQRKPRSEYKFFSPRLRERLEMMRDDLPQGQHIRSIHDMSYAAKCNNVGITLTVYRRRPDDYLLETYDAELYADEIFLGRGHGKDVREAHKYAFIHSRDELLGASLNELLATRKRLIELNLDDPLLLDVQYRGPFHDVGNNMSNLKMANDWPLAEEKDINDIIILEDEDDKRKNYFKTLEISATQNSMLLEWVRSGRDEGMPHRCQLFLEKIKIADVKSPNKVKAKNLAAFEALKNLRATQTVIRYSVDGEKPPLFTFTDVQEKAKEREEVYKRQRAEETGEAAEEDSEEKTEEGDDKEMSREERREKREKERVKEREKEELEDRCMDEVIGEELDQYLLTDDLEGVILGEDLPVAVKRRVAMVAVEKGMLVMPCGTDDLILLNKNMYQCQDILRKLQENDNKLGKYYIAQLKVAGSDKPQRFIDDEESDDGEDGDTEHKEVPKEEDATPKKVATEEEKKEESVNQETPMEADS